jgi:myo-inositol-1(or 4)-monophosphatase
MTDTALSTAARSVPAQHVDPLVAVAARAARVGGAAILEMGDRGVLAVKSSATDPVTAADQLSERVIVALLQAARPQDGLVAEEGAAAESRSGYRWVIDPLDGTVNYLYGLSHVAVSVACEELRDGDWQPVAAAVYDVYEGATFTSGRGLGSFRDGERLAVTRPRDLASALVGTGFGYTAAARTRQAGVLSVLLPQVRDVRSCGSAALELCRVAAGLTDAYVEDELAQWDTAAGRLIVTEAGGYVSNYGSGGVVAAGPGIHRDLCALVTSAGTSDEAMSDATRGEG